MRAALNQPLLGHNAAICITILAACGGADTARIKLRYRHIQPHTGAGRDHLAGVGRVYGTVCVAMKDDGCYAAATGLHFNVNSFHGG